MNCQETPRGYFANPVTGKQLVTGESVSCPIVEIAHLPGKPLSGICRYLFWWVRIPQYQLLSEVVYVTKYCEEIRVPVGFVFDGGTIPWCLWWLYPPDKPECLWAFAIHDYLCVPPYRFASEEVHEILYDACRVGGCPKLRAKLIYCSVLWFGPSFDSEKNQRLRQGGNAINGNKTSGEIK